MASLGMKLQLGLQSQQSLINPILGLSPLELELLLDESRDGVERFYEQEPEYRASGNYFYKSSFTRNAIGVKGKISREEHLRTPQILVQKSKLLEGTLQEKGSNQESAKEGETPERRAENKKYTITYNPELEARLQEKLKKFHRHEGEDTPLPEFVFTHRFSKEWRWIKEQQQKIVEYLLQRQEKYLTSGNIFDLEAVTPLEIAEYIGYTSSTVYSLLRNLTVQLADGNTIFAKELAPSRHTTVIKGLHALSELQKDAAYFADGKWKVSDERLRPVLQERYGLNIVRRTVAKYR